MKFTDSWLRRFLHTSATTDEIANTLTAIGLEIESVTHLGDGLESFTVARVLKTEPHPNADKLRVCRVATHSGERQIVCGAPNARADINVILADIGDVIPTNGMVIKPAKIRDVESAGMLCSARELGLGEDHDGIMELPESAAVGEKAVDVLGLNDVLYDIAITPNRGDCLGVYGIARDLAAAGIGTLSDALRSNAIATDHLEPAIALSLQTDDCPHFVAYRIDNIQNRPSPAWLQQQLRAIGVKSISAAVDVTNYFAFTYGRPLHAYDANKLTGAITVRKSRKGEPFNALNDEHYELPEGLCAIADDAGILGLGGVIGGKSSACSEGTASIILESAWFDPQAIANTGRTLHIDTDARYRFERYVDPESTASLAAQAAKMILDLCGGDVTGYSVAGAAKISPKSIAFDAEYTEARTGLSIERSKQQQLLETLGFHIDGDVITVPSWRPDVTIMADISEEILRLHGYDKLEETPLPTAEMHVRNYSVQDTARSALTRRGLSETIHYAFTDTQYADAFHTSDVPPVQVENPISHDLSVMRPHLFCNLLPALARNIARSCDRLALFETGTVFSGVSPQQQMLQLACVRTGTSPLHWAQPSAATTIYDVKADLFALLEALGFAVENCMITRDVPAWYHPGKAGRVSLGPKNILGYFGELHPAVARLFGIEAPVMLCESDLNAISRLIKQKKPKAFSANEFQTSTKDFAFVVDAEMAAGSLQQTIAKADKQLIRNVTCFDVYSGKNIADGKKSLAFSVTLQADDRTLNEEDITRVSQAIIASANKKGAVLR